MKNRFWKTVLWQTVGAGVVSAAMWALVMWLHRNTPPVYSFAEHVPLFLILVGATTLGAMIASVIVNYDD